MCKGGWYEMKYFYDMHIHSALSPCADNDMTPNNIVNMALIKGLDIIAVTDHNTCGNVRAVMRVSGDRLLVIPGMEVETREEVHMVCYFPDIESAEKMEAVVKQNMPKIINREEIYGEQLYMDEEDNVIGKEKYLLVTATDLTVSKTIEYAKKFNGIAIPAHIDRSSYSIISNLGFISDELDISSVEITKKNREKLFDEYKKYNIISNSDAHYLEDISEAEFFVKNMSKNAEKLIHYLCKKE